MEYSLRRQLGMSICGWVERVLDAYKHSLVENSTIYQNRSSDWSIWLVMCRLYGGVAAEAKFDNVNANVVVRKRV